MALTDVNTVPLGEAGTGAAYILPKSEAIDNISNYIDSTVKQQQIAALLKQKQAQELGEQWQKNRLNIKQGSLWQPEINQYANDVMQKGMKLQAAGINPNQYYTDPAKQKQLDDYNTSKQYVEGLAAARDGFVAQAKPVDKALSVSAPGEFDQASVKAHHDFFNQKLADIVKNGYQMPGISKTYDMQAAIDKLPTTKVDTTSLPDKNGVVSHLVLPDSDAHEQTATNFLSNTPQAKASIEQQAGMPFDKIGNETDPAKVKKNIDDFWRSTPNIPQLGSMGINSYDSPKYQSMIDAQAKQIANAAKVKQNAISMIKDQLDNKVSTTNDKTLNYRYQDEMRARERMGMEKTRFNDWLKTQQNEAGNFSLGNQDSYVPVIKQNVDPDSKERGQSFAEPEKGASLYGVNIPQVETVVRPSSVTDMKTGKTSKNTSPFSVKVSQIQMVPVFNKLPSDMDSRNGSEISARQLKEIVDGKSSFAKLNNITFQPYAYGVKSEKDDKNLHTIETPVKFSYDALKGSNVKKINTATFDQATESLKLLQSNPKFQKMSPKDQLEFISKKYNVKLD